MQLMLALFFIAAGAGAVVSRTPNSLTPPPAERAGQVRELWPLLLQCEHRRVILSGGGNLVRATRADAWASYVRRAASDERSKCEAVCSGLLSLLSFPRRLYFWECDMYLKEHGENDDKVHHLPFNGWR
jgi:hypothetical protein